MSECILITSHICAFCHELFNESHSVALTKCFNFYFDHFFLVLVNGFATVSTPLSGISLKSGNIQSDRS